MAYFVCRDCGEVFHENEAWKVTAKYTEDGVVIEDALTRCPSCGSEDFGFACRCERCGDYIIPDRLRGGFYCDKCVSELTTFDNVKKFLSENIDCFAELLYEEERKKCGK